MSKHISKISKIISNQVQIIHQFKIKLVSSKKLNKQNLKIINLKTKILKAKFVDSKIKQINLRDNKIYFKMMKNKKMMFSNYRFLEKDQIL
jgi:hypothetical protein